MISRLPPLRDLRTLLLLELLVFALYARTLDVGFLSDDFEFVWQFRRNGWFAGWGREDGGFFRPLTVASSWLDDRVFGGDPIGAHAVAVALHGTTAWLVGCVVARFTAALLPDEAHRSGWASALGFAVLASHTEPVVWLACRGDLLAVPLALLATYVVLVDTPTLRSTALGCGLLALACSAKESVAPTPAIWLVLFFVRSRALGRSMVRAEIVAIVAGFLTLATFLAGRALYLGSFVGGYGARTRPPANPLVLLDRLRKLVVRPLFPPLPDGWRRTRWLLIPPITLALIGLPTLARLRTVPRALRLGLAAFLLVGVLTCFPVLGFELGRFGTESERLVYFASAFLVPACFAAFRVAYGPRGAALAIVVFLAIHAAGTVWAQERWREAARMTRTIVRTLAPLDPGTTCVANLPDSIGGAVVFREGLPQAMAIELDRPLEAPFRVGAIQRWGLAERSTFEARPTGGVLRLAPRAKLEPSRYPPCVLPRVDGSLVVDRRSTPEGVERIVVFERDPVLRGRVVVVPRADAR